MLTSGLTIGQTFFAPYHNNDFGPDIYNHPETCRISYNKNLQYSQVKGIWKCRFKQDWCGKKKTVKCPGWTQMFSCAYELWIFDSDWKEAARPQ